MSRRGLCKVVIEFDRYSTTATCILQGLYNFGLYVLWAHKLIARSVPAPTVSYPRWPIFQPRGRIWMSIPLWVFSLFITWSEHIFGDKCLAVVSISRDSIYHYKI